MRSASVVRGKWSCLAGTALLAVQVTSSFEDGSSNLGIMGLLPQALGDSAQPTAAQPGEPVPRRLKSWLQQRGANVQSIDFRPSKAGEEAGYGLFLAQDAKTLFSRTTYHWFRPWIRAPPEGPVAASFPLHLAITAANIISDAQLGPGYQLMVSRGLLEERSVVMAHLALERARGASSPLSPWLDALPTEFHSPLYWSPQELQSLRGTVLERAVARLKQRLQLSWKRAEGPLAQAAEAVAAPRAPTYDDWVWAHSVFWSRGQSLPVPNTQGTASQLVAGKAPSAAAELLTVHEAIIPGLDFANHAPTAGAQCWWDVAALPPPTPPPHPAPLITTNPPGPQATSTSPLSTHSPHPPTPSTHLHTSPATSPSSSAEANQTSSPSSCSPALANVEVRLQLYRGARVVPGQELFISYGDSKPNEELLLLHGFVVDPHPPTTATAAHGRGSKGGSSAQRARSWAWRRGGPTPAPPQAQAQDSVMVVCPVPPPGQWDVVMESRMGLLMGSGLSPQFFLHASSIVQPTPASATPTPTPPQGGEGGAPPAWAPVPAEVLEALEVFVLAPKEVDMRLQGLRAVTEGTPLAKTAREQQGTSLAHPPFSTAHPSALSCASLDLTALDAQLPPLSTPPAGHSSGIAPRGAAAAPPSGPELTALLGLLGLRMAAVSTFVRLLEVQLVELESEETGSGALEVDERLLAAHRAAVDRGAHPGSEGRLPHRLWCAVVYRAGQKRVTRAHLVGARRELQHVMRLIERGQALQQA
ncbi:hypothetical protein V8C86DRAFT_631700 [Haematococcus lacustris]